MYTAGYTSPPLTNNPFIPDGGAHPSARFPDLSTPPTSNMNMGMGMQQQFGSWGGGGGGPQQQGLYQQYPQQQQQQQQPQMTLGYAPQQQQHQMSNNNGYLSPSPQGYGGQAQGQMQMQMQGTQYHPSTPFGQQQLSSANVSGSSYSYLQPQHQQQQTNLNAYNPAQQQLQNNPGYIAQFDPYSSLSQVFNDGQQQQGGGYGTSSGSGMAHNLSTGSSSTTPSILSSSSSTSTSNSTTSSYGTSPTGDPHPRDYIRTHKAEIERWDAYAWKQFLGAFESLMKAWEARKGEVESKLAMLGAQMQMGVNGMGMQMQMQYDGGYYVAQMQQEGLRLQGLKKEAENNYDSVAASMFQMREVFGGYRQSGDLASKSRVREATNAALQGLPGWPQPY